LSLDVYLEGDTPFKRAPSSGIFIREDGRTKEITREEWDLRKPGVEPVVFSRPDEETTVLWHGNVTHNLGKMADKSGIYRYTWRPDENGIGRAVELIATLRDGLSLLKENPAYFKQFNPENGYGSYEVLVSFVGEYLAACEAHPSASVRVWR
jgi:hypothetical protein